MGQDGWRLALAEGGARWQTQNDDQGFLDYLLALLQGSWARPEQKPTPPRWRETFEAAATLLSRGGVSTLLRAGGWAPARFLDGDRLRSGALWDCPGWRALVPVVDGNALTFVEGLWAYEAKRSEDARENASALLELSGRAIAASKEPFGGLLVYILARPMALLGAQDVAKSVAKVPLVAMTIGVQPEVEAPPKLSAATLVGRSWGWAYPWLSDDLSWWWLRAESLKTVRGPARFGQTLEGVKQALQVSLEAAELEGALQWLFPVMRFFSMLGKRTRGEAVEESLALLSELSLQEIERARQVWGELLELGERLRSAWSKVRRLHPVDRGPEEALFLAYWSDWALDASLKKISAARDRVVRRVG